MTLHEPQCMHLCPALLIVRVVLGEQQQVIVSEFLGNILLNGDTGCVEVIVLQDKEESSCRQAILCRVLACSCC